MKSNPKIRYRINPAQYIYIPYKQNGDKINKPGFSWTLVTTIIGLCITATSLFFTSENIKDTEKWKKAEFIAAQFEKYSNNESVIFVSNFLDYFTVTIQAGSKNVVINKDLVSFYLQADSLSEERDNEIKALIRKHFDNYLDKLSLFNRYYKAGVVSYEDVKPYLEYQINLIAKNSDDDHHKYFQEVLWDYINRFGFTDVQDICSLFGYNIKPNEKISRNSFHDLNKYEEGILVMKRVLSRKPLN